MASFRFLRSVECDFHYSLKRLKGHFAFRHISLVQRQVLQKDIYTAFLRMMAVGRVYELCAKYQDIPVSHDVKIAATARQSCIALARDPLLLLLSPPGLERQLGADFLSSPQR